MKNTKKNRHRVSSNTMGSAILFQSSIVVTRKSVKSVVGTLSKCLIVAVYASLDGR